MDGKLAILLLFVVLVFATLFGFGFLSPAAQLNNAKATAEIVRADADHVRAEGDYIVDGANATAIVRHSCQDTPYDANCLPTGTKLVTQNQGIPPYLYVCPTILIILTIIVVSVGNKAVGEG